MVLAVMEAVVVANAFHKSLMQYVLAAVILVAGLTWTSEDAFACKCIQSSVAKAYNDVDAVYAGTIVFKITIAAEVWHIVRVRGVFGGCAKKNDWVIVKTNSGSAACGVDMDEGKTYLLFGDEIPSMWTVSVHSVNSCDPNQKVSSLSASERSWLMARTVCCEKDCACVAGQPTVSCFANPCDFADCPSGTCQANYCGGCNAEFYSETGELVCAPCASDEDCSWNFHCLSQAGGGGVCVPECEEDADCNEGYWCALINEMNDKGCKPYQEEGESCGGFTPPWGISKCKPGLSCTDYSPMIPDLPGRCRKPCAGDQDCLKSQYCSSSQFCRDMGACFALSDCSMPSNSFSVVDCEGFPTCENGSCGWTCGSDPCTDLGGVNFGACEMILGWAPIGGKCTLVSGCGDQGYTFFDFEFECQSQCGMIGIPK